MINRLDYKVQKELNEKARQFNTFEEYENSFDWEDWYDDFLEDVGEPIRDGNEVTEKASMLIYTVLRLAWDNRTFYLVDDRTGECREMRVDKIFDYFEDSINEYKYEVHDIDDLNEMLKDIQGGIAGYRISTEGTEIR